MKMYLWARITDEAHNEYCPTCQRNTRWHVTIEIVRQPRGTVISTTTVDGCETCPEEEP